MHGSSVWVWVMIYVLGYRGQFLPESHIRGRALAELPKETSNMRETCMEYLNVGELPSDKPCGRT